MPIHAVWVASSNERSHECHDLLGESSLVLKSVNITEQLIGTW
jgi:hypothetical protein